MLNAEDRLIEWLRAEIGRRGLSDHLGDDAAWLRLNGDWAVSCDQQIERAHFVPGTPAHRIARRLVAVNLSDLAAAGARPGYAMATVAAPRTFDFKGFFRGLLNACEEFGLRLAGGDLASASRTSTSLTVFGRRPARGRWLRRDRARTGDVLWLGGTVGESALGRALLERGAKVTARSVRLPPEVPRALRGAARQAVTRHLEPAPQLQLGAWLGRRRRAAAIDVSDGVVLDLGRLARASGVDCRLEAAALPTSDSFGDLGLFLGRNPLRLALAGGEDYVLLFALPKSIKPPKSFGATAIGRVTAPARGRRARVELGGTGLDESQFRGWDHLRGGFDADC